MPTDSTPHKDRIMYVPNSFLRPDLFLLNLMYAFGLCKHGVAWNAL